MALALLAVWPLAVNHCKLETIPGFAFLHCAVAPEVHHSATDCDDCCAVEKSQYCANHLSLHISKPNLLPGFSTLALAPLAAGAAEVGARILTAAPPSLFSSRHFYSRTALLARAPSLAP